MKFYVLIIIFFFAFIKINAQHKANTIPIKDSTNNYVEFSLSADYFLKPENGSYINPNFYADYKSMRIEGRYNYESINTASLFTGWKISTGKKLTAEIIPMFGLVIGQTNGVAPALEAEIRFKKLDFYTESEYVIDFAGKENNFLFVSSELAYRISKPFRVGIAALRTSLYQTELIIQRGIFGEYYFGKFRAGLYYYEPLTSSTFADISLTAYF